MSSLAGVKVGDQIIVGTQLLTVTTVSKFYCVTEGGGKWALRDGCSLPRSSWSNRYAELATPENLRRRDDALADVADRRLRHRVNGADWFRLPAETVRKVAALLDEQDAG